MELLEHDLADQLLNAHHVEKIGAGLAVAKLSSQSIDEFVDRLDDFRGAMSGKPKADLEPVLNAVEREIP